MHVAGDKSSNLDFDDFRVSAASSMIVRFKRVEHRIATDSALVSQSTQFTCEFSLAATSLVSNVARNPGISHYTTAKCPSIDVLCYVSGHDACQNASETRPMHKASSQVNHSFDSSRGIHTFAYSTDMLSSLMNQLDLGVDGHVTTDNELVKVLPFDSAVSNVAAIITADVYYNPGMYIPAL